MRKASVLAGSIAVATAGSAILGGVALAGGHHGHSHNYSDDDNYGGSGKGGKATNNCLNVGIPILSGLGLGGSGDAKGATCNAEANGTGGDAY
jgi:hypothetical protein